MAVATLPDFQDPPLTEVALSVQFSQLNGLTPLVIPQVWDLFRTRFPKGQVQPPLNAAFEIFGAQPVQQQLSLEMLQTVPPLRYWFLDASEGQLIQVQLDRFVHNWRKQKVDDKYPRYETMRPDFEKELRTFSEWAEKELGQHVVPNQCEVTYINQITLGGGDTWKRLHEIVRYWQPLDRSLVLENARVQARFLIPNPKDSNAEPIGRLHVIADPMIRREGEELVQLTLTARGGPRAQTIDGALEFLDIAREAVLKHFIEITTPHMQKTWGRKS